MCSRRTAPRRPARPRSTRASWTWRRRLPEPALLRDTPSAPANPAPPADLPGADALRRHRAVSRLLDGDHRVQGRRRSLPDGPGSVLVSHGADPRALPSPVSSHLLLGLVPQHHVALRLPGARHSARGECAATETTTPGRRDTPWGRRPG